MRGEGRSVRVGGYLRLSREDGDKAESDSIANQRKILTSYCQSHPELQLVEFYIDDGCTGTHFDRPAFRRMERDWEPRGGSTACWSRTCPDLGGIT